MIERKVLSVGKWAEEQDFGPGTREWVEDVSASVSQVQGVLKSQRLWRPSAWTGCWLRPAVLWGLSKALGSSCLGYTVSP